MFKKKFTLKTKAGHRVASLGLQQKHTKKKKKNKKTQENSVSERSKCTGDQKCQMILVGNKNFEHQGEQKPRSQP